MRMRSKILCFVSTLMTFVGPAFALETPPINGAVVPAAVGAADRMALPNKSTSACTIQAMSGNAGTVYVGGYTVTNAAGANPGIKLSKSSSISNISVLNSKYIYIAADVLNDGVYYLCN